MGDRGWIAAAIAAGALVLVAILAIAGVFGGGDDDEGTPTVAEDFGAVTTPEPAPPAQPKVKRVEVGGSPDTIAAGGGYVWVADSLAGTLKRIHPTSLRPVPVQSAGFPTDVSADDQAAWLALPDRGAIQQVTREGGGDPIKVNGFPFQVATGEGAVWAMSQKTVEQIDPGSGSVEGSPAQLGGNASAIAAGEGGVWVIRGNREVIRLDPGSGEIQDDPAQVRGAFNVTAGESAVWVLGARGNLTRLDPESGQVVGDRDPVATGTPLDVAAGLGFVWVTSDDGTLLRIDPKAGAEAGPPIDVGRDPVSVAVGEDAVWVASAREGAVYKITP